MLTWSVGPLLLEAQPPKVNSQLAGLTSKLEAMNLHEAVFLAVFWLAVRVSGFDPFAWSAGPDSDLWSSIAAEITSRRPGCITIHKLKSHMSFSEARTSWELWFVVGNSKANFWAKQALAELSEQRPDFNDKTP